MWLRQLSTAATRFVKAQDTTLHFLRAGNSTRILAFPLPTKQALRGPHFSATSSAPLAPRTLTCGSSPTDIKNMGHPFGVSHILAYTTHFDTMQRKAPERCIRYFTDWSHLN